MFEIHICSVYTDYVLFKVHLRHASLYIDYIRSLNTNSHKNRKWDQVYKIKTIIKRLLTKIRFNVSNGVLFNITIHIAT